MTWAACLRDRLIFLLLLPRRSSLGSNSLLQPTVPIETLARAISRNSDGSASGIAGAVIDIIIAGRS